MAKTGIYIAGLSEFRAALKASAIAEPAKLTAAIKAAGEPIVKESSQLAPVRTGKLAGGYKVQARATTGSIVNRVPYAAGAEWGTHKKWSGFNRYGSRGERFAGKAIDDRAEETVLAIYEGIHDIATIYGWANP